MANEYLVDNSHPQASDLNSGLEDSPWLTIQQAANTLKAGDICYVSQGTYNEVVQPQNSGLKDNLITFKAIGEVKVHGFRIIDRTYIRVIGFEITRLSNNLQAEGIFLLRSHGSEIINNYIHHTLSLGIRHHYSGLTNLMIIKNNRIEYTGVTPGNETGEIAIAINGNKNIVEYNDVSHVGDFINIWGEKNIIRNNHFHDCYLSDFRDFTQPEGPHIDGIQYFSPHLHIPLNRTLVECNYINNISVPHAHIILLQDEEKDGSCELVFRNNLCGKIGSYIGGAAPFIKLRLIHNTFFDFLEAQSPKAMYCISFLYGSTGGKLVNNIFFNCVRNGGGVYYLDTVSKDGFYSDYNAVYNSNCGQNCNWDIPMRDEIHGLINYDPGFVDYPNNDFHLQHNSPCANAAGPLTTTASTGSGDVIGVIDAGYFSDGWGITEGDYINVGGNDSLKILFIDYDNNSIMVDQNVSWIRGDQVNLSYYHQAPDIGAYEYREEEKSRYGILISRPFSEARVNGLVKIELNVKNMENIRYLMLFIDGLPAARICEPPYTYIWDTDSAQIGHHILEARAYALHAQKIMTQSDMIKLIVVNDKIEPPSNLQFLK